MKRIVRLAAIGVVVYATACLATAEIIAMLPEAIKEALSNHEDGSE